MRVMLLKDVYKLGRAGDVKKVADGYGRNYLMPQGLAVLATPGALKQVERIRTSASEERSRMNQELSSVAERLTGLTLHFPAKAGETGKLYGSITSAMIVEAVEKQTGTAIDRRQVDSQPIKSLGSHTVHIRLTIDLVPEITVLVYREGESPDTVYGEIGEETEEAFADLIEELEAEETEEAVSGDEEPAPFEMAPPGGGEGHLQEELEAEEEGRASGEAEELADEA
ncbi:MAG TPA: 50S ribosomal protein L9 [Anaerolineales bacterium]|nr:50S ribosomal protein L9 [Anaerolineales bacterium]